MPICRQTVRDRQTETDRQKQREKGSQFYFHFPGVTYESTLDHMRPVIERGIKVWLQALRDLDRDGKLAQWNWNTRLSCSDRQLKKWSGGQMMFE